MRRMPSCLPHSGRHPDYAGGRRHHRDGLKQRQTSALDRLITTFSVSLVPNQLFVALFAIWLPSSQPFANCCVLNKLCGRNGGSALYQSYGTLIACNEDGCR